MRMSGRPAAMLLIGLGLGAIAGVFLHTAAAWTGLALVMVGIGMAMASGSGAADEEPDSAREPATERPGLRGMGTRVEQVLRLAEEQADDHRARAARDAERIVAEARAEARAILDKAREQAS